MPDNYGNIADCEPSPSLRNRIANDLRIKGEISFPQKIDMRAIIPVYNFQAEEPFTTRERRGNSNIGGTNSLTILLADMFIENPLADHGEINEWHVSVLLDAAGRAALAGIRIDCFLYPLERSIQGNLIGFASTHVVAGAGLGMRTNFGTIFQVREGGNFDTGYFVGNVCHVDGLKKFLLTKTGGLQVVLTLSTFPNNFPANTTIDWWARTIIYGKGV
jgi:hypothetical protein